MVATLRLDELQMAALGRRELIPSLIGLFSVAAVLVFLGLEFTPVGDTRLFTLWLVVTAAIVAMNVTIAVAALIRQPGDREAVRVWQPVARVVRTLLNFAVIPSPWVLLPGAAPTFVAVMLMLYLWFLVTEVMATADPHSQTWVALIGLPVSLAAFLFTSHMAYAVPLSLMFALAAASLFVLQRLFRRGAIRSLGSAVSIADASCLAPMLTRRQLEVLGHLSEGRSNKDIARALGIAPETVKSHVAQTLAALDAPNRTEAAVKGRALGLV